jgi:hypothetical protein
MTYEIVSSRRSFAVGFSDDRDAGCCSIFARLGRKSREPPSTSVDTDSLNIAEESLPAKRKECATSILATVLEHQVQSSECVNPVVKISIRPVDTVTNLHDSRVMGRDLSESLRRQEAMTKFEDTYKRFQFVAGNQIIARPLLQTSLDYDPIGDIGKMAQEVERYVILFKKERNVQRENRGRAERIKGKMKTVYQKLFPGVEGTLKMATGIAAVHLPSLTRGG